MDWVSDLSVADFISFVRRDIAAFTYFGVWSLGVWSPGYPNRKDRPRYILSPHSPDFHNNWFVVRRQSGEAYYVSKTGKVPSHDDIQDLRSVTSDGRKIRVAIRCFDCQASPNGKDGRSCSTTGMLAVFVSGRDSIPSHWCTQIGRTRLDVQLNRRHWASTDKSSGRTKHISLTINICHERPHS